MKNDIQTPETTGNYGKFDTAEELLKAYNALEAEFTKRCQLIGKLQAELDSKAEPEKKSGNSENTIAQADTAVSDGVSGENTATSPESFETASTVQQASTDTTRQRDGGFEAVMNEIAEHAREYAETLSAIPEIMDACVALYKQRRLCGGVIPSPAGAAVLTPVKRPKTLLEAKILADTMLG